MPHQRPPTFRQSLATLVGVFACVVALAAPAATAQRNPTVIEESDRVVYKKVTTMEFGDVYFEGELTRPSGTYQVVRKRTRFRNLIELRGSFRPELRRSVSGL